jgi:glycosyltransferase involved in cell wall biosynthesis
MNIWIFNHYAVTPDLAGGTRHFDLGKELVSHGHDVTVFASSFRHFERRDVKLSVGETWSLEEVAGVKVVWLKTLSYTRNNFRRVLNMLSYSLRAWRVGLRLPRLNDVDIHRPDVVIGSSVHLLAVLAAYWVARSYGIKFIMEVRDLWPQSIVDMAALSRNNPIVGILRALETFLYRKAECVITVLPLAREYITSCGVPCEKIIWIPNGVDLSRFEEITSADKNGETFRVMYLGAHGRANALGVVLKAARIVQVRDYQAIEFVLIGNGSEKPQLTELAEKLGLKNVKFRDSVQKSQVPEVLHQADVLIFNLTPAQVFKYGISSNKLYDYMAAGKPIIFSAAASNNPVEEAQCGLTVSPEAPIAFAGAVIDLYNMSPEKRKTMGQRGREYVEKHHAIPMLAERLIRCIEGVR